MVGATIPYPIGLRVTSEGASGLAEPVSDQRLQLTGQTEAPVSGRKVHEGQPGVELRTQELAGLGRGRGMGG